MVVIGRIAVGVVVVGILADRDRVIHRQIGLIRETAFLVGRPLAELFVHIRDQIGQMLVLQSHAEPGDAVECLPVDHAITQRALDRLQEDGLGHLAAEGKQLVHPLHPTITCVV
jgi:hypothetical protein